MKPLQFCQEIGAARTRRRRYLRVRVSGLAGKPSSWANRRSPTSRPRMAYRTDRMLRRPSAAPPKNRSPDSAENARRPPTTTEPCSAAPGHTFQSRRGRTKRRCRKQNTHHLAPKKARSASADPAYAHCSLNLHLAVLRTQTVGDLERGTARDTCPSHGISFTTPPNAFWL